jgi:hypothetical protein
MHTTEKDRERERGRERERHTQREKDIIHLTRAEGFINCGNLDVMLGEISQTQKEKNFVILLALRIYFQTLENMSLKPSYVNVACYIYN